jgi:hypothetical protein
MLDSIGRGTLELCTKITDPVLSSNTFREELNNFSLFSFVPFIVTLFLGLLLISPHMVGILADWSCREDTMTARSRLVQRSGLVFLLFTFRT